MNDHPPVYGCPACDVFAIHPCIATPSAEVDHANSLPDAVFECVACDARFDRFDAVPVDDYDSVHDVDDYGPSDDSDPHPPDTVEEARDVPVVDVTGGDEN